MLIRFLLTLLIAAALAVLYFFVALNWSYSTGERAGYVQKLSKKGWICKTWEGELALVSLPGSLVEKFYFTVHDDEVANRITKLVGKRVSLHYEEKVGLPTTCFGETRHFVSDVTEASDNPAGAPAAAPSTPAAAPAAASAPAVPSPPPVSAPVPAVPAAPVQVVPVAPAPAASQ